ncbi:MAG: type II secretion system F family protein [Acidimicrobiia bacterium]|nr:type II secretion system F family protein [Acidimicrobiia bacterium]
MQIVIAVVLGVAVVSLAIGLVLVFTRESLAEDQLAQYQSAALEGRSPDTEEYQLAETGVVKSAVDATGRMAERTGLLDRVENELEQADLPLRAAEAIFFYVTAVLVFALLAFVISSEWIVGVIAMIVGAVVPVAVLKSRRRQRLQRFEAELPDTLGLLAGSLRAGFSFQQGLEAVAGDATGPMGEELRRVFNEVQLGRTLEDALEDSAERMESDDLRWTVLAVRIQREAGGNLAELLDTVAETMSQRERLRAEIRTLTAEGRMSGIVLGIFPFAFAGILVVISPGYLDALFEEPAGIAAMIAASIAAVFGFVWLRKIVTIEV